MTKYGYSVPVEHEIGHMLSMAMRAFDRTVHATLQEDFGGTDFHYLIGDLPVQARARFDRGQHFHGVDITFRSTEPAMIAAQTYAPLMLVVWLEGGLAELGYLVDIPSLDRAMRRGTIPPFDQRLPVVNRDRTRFYVVQHAELDIARSLIAVGDRYSWTRTGPADRVTRIINKNARDRQVTIDWNQTDEIDEAADEIG